LATSQAINLFTIISKKLFMIYSQYLHSKNQFSWLYGVLASVQHNHAISWSCLEREWAGWAQGAGGCNHDHWTKIDKVQICDPDYKLKVNHTFPDKI
jgi:homogentisate 1,2-dioxygenase